MSAIFCAALLLRRRRVQNVLRSALKRYAGAHLKVTYEPPSKEDREHASAVWDIAYEMIVARTDTSQLIEGRLTPRLAALKRLRRNLRGPLRGTDIVHYCPFGCHASQEEALLEITADLTICFLDHPPPVPAWNKWSKIMPPLMWFCAFVAVHGILAGIMVSLSALRDGEIADLSEEDLLGLDTQKAYLQQEQVRFRKTQRFLTAECTPTKLMSCTQTLRCVLPLMNRCFKASQRHPDTPQSLLLFIHDGSPAETSIRHLCASLRDEHHVRWTPLIGGVAWSEDSYVIASTPAWLEAGQLFSRFVLAMRKWPFPLGRLVGDGTTLEEKQQVADRVFQTCEHVHPYMKHYKERAVNAVGVLSQDNLEYTGDVFRNMPVANIISENSFAADHVRRQTAHGMEIVPSTHAANHVLATSKTILGLALAKQAQPVQHSRPQKRRAQTAWHEFLKRRRRAGSMQELAEQWAEMSEEQRADFAPTDTVLTRKLSYATS
jgi:hypothetical protein